MSIQQRVAKVRSLLQSGKLKQAINICANLCKKYPGEADLWIWHGSLLSEQHDLKNAEVSFKKALALQPDNPRILFLLGSAQYLSSQSALAKVNFERVVQLQPDYAEAWNNLATIARNQNDYLMARKYYETILELKPDFVFARNNLGNVLNYFGEHELAMKQFKMAVKQSPEYRQAFSNALFTQSYYVLGTPDETLKFHQEWDRKYGQVERFVHDRAHGRVKNKKLRIAYVSPDFRNHPVAHFMLPILKAHDKNSVEVYCYAELSYQDDVTREIKKCADHWCVTSGLSGEVLAKRIYDEQIDVLIDLAGHTGGNRLDAFVYKPAPVQVTYLGYFSTTGLSAIDYWLTDNVLHSPDCAELSVEKPWRLKRSCLSFEPLEDVPDVTDRYNEETITFGSFNNLSKISEQAYACWGELLKRMPDSQLLMKASQLKDQDVREKVYVRFDKMNIDRNRVRLVEPTKTYYDHMAQYGEIDIALDSMPRTGGSTTMEALWMGVPVVTLASDRFIGRLSSSMLVELGLQELVTNNEEAYIELCVQLANDRQRRHDLRSGMRERIKKSALSDGRSLARSLEDAYMEMCEAAGAGDGNRTHV